MKNTTMKLIALNSALIACLTTPCLAASSMGPPALSSVHYDKQAQSSAAPMIPLVNVAVPAYLANLSNIACKQRRPGWGLECTSGDFRISAAPTVCGTNRSYGKVHPDSGDVVLLRDRFLPTTVEWTAKLSNDQLVCVSAEAGHAASVPEWYYVTAIPVHTVKKCVGKQWCEKPGDLPIEWAHPPAGQACQLKADDMYVGDCPSGWVRASEFGEFSMGL